MPAPERFCRFRRLRAHCCATCCCATRRCTACTYPRPLPGVGVGGVAAVDRRRAAVLDPAAGGGQLRHRVSRPGGQRVSVLRAAAGRSAAGRLPGPMERPPARAPPGTGRRDRRGGRRHRALAGSCTGAWPRRSPIRRVCTATPSSCSARPDGKRAAPLPAAANRTRHEPIAMAQRCHCMSGPGRPCRPNLGRAERGVAVVLAGQSCRSTWPPPPTGAQRSGQRVPKTRPVSMTPAPAAAVRATAQPLP